MLVVVALVVTMVALVAVPVEVVLVVAVVTVLQVPVKMHVPEQLIPDLAVGVLIMPKIWQDQVELEEVVLLF